jgi:transposase
MDTQSEGFPETAVASQTVRPFQKMRRPPPRYWSTEQKRRIIAEAMEPGASVAEVARRHDVNANQVFNWCKKAREVAARRASRVEIVPVGIISHGVPACTPEPEPGPREDHQPQGSGTMEIRLGRVTVTVDASVDEPALCRVLSALRATV